MNVSLLTRITVRTYVGPQIVIDSLNALHTYCKKADENKEVFVELKGLIPIHARMFDTNNVIQRLSMKIMSVAATVHPAKLFIAGLDVILFC